VKINPGSFTPAGLKRSRKSCGVYKCAFAHADCIMDYFFSHPAPLRAASHLIKELAVSTRNIG
jgi:hypothetical protein